MTEFDINNIGLKVGLEIHQQLDTKKKLFCDCTPIEEDEFSRKFSRFQKKNIKSFLTIFKKVFQEFKIFF